MSTAAPGHTAPLPTNDAVQDMARLLAPLVAAHRLRLALLAASGLVMFLVVAIRGASGSTAAPTEIGGLLDGSLAVATFCALLYRSRRLAAAGRLVESAPRDAFPESGEHAVPEPVRKAVQAHVQAAMASFVVSLAFLVVGCALALKMGDPWVLLPYAVLGGLIALSGRLRTSL